MRHFRIPVDRPQLHEDQWPKLVKLRPAAVEMLLASISLAMSEQSSAELEGEEGFVIGGWLRSSAEPRVLVRHLQSLMLPSEPVSGADICGWRIVACLSGFGPCCRHCSVSNGWGRSTDGGR